MSTPSRTTTVALLAVILGVLVVWALHATRTITLPLALAVFVILLVQPLDRWLTKRMPHGLSLLIIFVLLLLAGAAVVGALWYSGYVLQASEADYSTRARNLAAEAQAWLNARGLPADFSPSAERMVGLAAAALQSAWTWIGLLLLALSFVVLGLMERREYQNKIREAMPERDARATLDSLQMISKQLERYVGVLFVTSLITGGGIALLCLVFGIDLAFVWGFVAFVLNWVPTVGMLIAGVAVVVFAFGTEGLTTALLFAAAVIVFQIIMGNFVEPKLAGRAMALSPLVALLSIVFWGWVWGIPGAFLGVPLTTMLVIVCMHVKRLWPVAILIGRLDRHELEERAQPVLGADPA